MLTADCYLTLLLILAPFNPNIYTCLGYCFSIWQVPCIVYCQIQIIKGIKKSVGMSTLNSLLCWEIEQWLKILSANWLGRQKWQWDRWRSKSTCSPKPLKAGVWHQKFHSEPCFWAVHFLCTIKSYFVSSLAPNLTITALYQMAAPCRITAPTDDGAAHLLIEE